MWMFSDRYSCMKSLKRPLSTETSQYLWHWQIERSAELPTQPSRTTSPYRFLHLTQQESFTVAHHRSMVNQAAK